MQALAAVPFARQQRWRFLEAALIWEGSVKRARVAHAFAIAINHVTKDIAAYEQLFPRNIQYNHRAKAYIAGARFKPNLATGNPDEYLSLMQAYAETSSAVMRPAVDPGLIEAVVVPQPGKAVDRETLSQVIQSIQRKEALDMTYATFTPEADIERRVWPHAIAFDGHRWHMRAYDEGRSDFRDFSLRRIQRSRVHPGEAPQSASEDTDWHRMVIAEVIPNPSLTARKQEIVAADFGMAKEGSRWTWCPQVRAAMLPYFARLHRLDVGPDARPQPRILLNNLEQLRPMLFSPDMD